MDYIIEEVMVGQIVVKFADDSRAVVAISTTNTPEEIDHLVSFYDPEFQPEPETAVNTFVSVGETRCSCKMDEMEMPELEPPEVAPVEAPPGVGLGLLDNGYTVAAALYYQSQGDTSVMNALNDYYSTLNGFSAVGLSSAIVQTIEDSKQALADTAAATAEGEEIFEQAFEELING